MAESSAPKFEYRVVTAWAGLPGSDVVVYESRNSPGVLLYFAWEEGQGKLLETPGARSGSPKAVPLDNSGSRIAMAHHGVEMEQEGQIDVINLASSEARGYRVRCLKGELIRDARLGPEHLTYMCGRLGQRNGYLRFVPLEAPSSAFALSLPAEFPELWPPQTRWLTSSQILMTNVAPSGSEQTACIGDISDWQPECRRLPFVSGAVSPDGEKVEVREGPLSAPSRVGVMPVHCLWDFGGPECVPLWAEASFQGIQELRRPGAWSPDSKNLYLLYGVHATPKEYQKYDSEVWRFDVESGELSYMGRIPNQPNTNDPYFAGFSFMSSPLPAMWSPDSAEILVEENACSSCSDATPWHAFSVETGRIRGLLEDAGFVIGILNKPQPED